MKALLVDTNLAAAPIHSYLLSRGYSVYVIGNNPDDFLAKVSDRYIQLDYSDISEITALVAREKFDFIIPGCNDLSYKVCSILASSFGLHGIDNHQHYRCINNKLEFRLLSEYLSIIAPRHYKLEDAIGHSGALIVKPVDSFSGRGVSVVQNPTNENLENAYNLALQASASGEVVVEDYICGDLFSHSAFICGGKVVVDFFVQEHCTASPYAVDCSHVVQLSGHAIDKLRQDVECVFSELNLVDGLFHTQFIYDGEKAWIIESTRRCPGDLYSLLVNKSCGFDYAEAYVKPFLGEEIQSLGDSNTTINSYVLRHTISHPHGGVFESLSLNVPIYNLDLYPLMTVGEHIAQAPYGRVGVLFAEFSSEEDLMQAYNLLIRREFVEFSLRPLTLQDS